MPAFQQPVPTSPPQPAVTAATYWLWNVLGVLIIVGPFIYMYKLLHAMNDLCADYNQRGI